MYVSVALSDQRRRPPVCHRAQSQTAASGQTLGDGRARSRLRSGRCGRRGAARCSVTLGRCRRRARRARTCLPGMDARSSRGDGRGLRAPRTSHAPACLAGDLGLAGSAGGSAAIRCWQRAPGIASSRSTAGRRGTPSRWSLTSPHAVRPRIHHVVQRSDPARHRSNRFPRGIRTPASRCSRNRTVVVGCSRPDRRARHQCRAGRATDDGRAHGPTIRSAAGDTSTSTGGCDARRRGHVARRGKGHSRVAT